jgi:hypothetical protein
VGGLSGGLSQAPHVHTMILSLGLVSIVSMLAFIRSSKAINKIAVALIYATSFVFFGGLI